MRQKRAKAYRKLMHLYSMSFGFRQPYQVLVDSEMCTMATSHKLDIIKHLGTVLQGEVKPMITQCCIHELYIQGKSQQESVDLAKTFERRKCNHREVIPGDECLMSVIGDRNKHRYVIATQSQVLRSELRAIPAVPIIHVNRSVMVLEPPSDATLKEKQLNEERSLHATGSDIALVESPKPEDTKPRKRKGPKGPNPLSMKKKKVDAGKEISNGQDPKTSTKRKRDHRDDETNRQDPQGDYNLSVQLQDPEGSKKKRKRRRKGKSELLVDTIHSEEAESEHQA
ncbi:Fcf1-domain-containing protein [Cyathus striatus]|nr:Fcf1-domain-containing protein [Cyathus striatus]